MILACLSGFAQVDDGTGILPRHTINGGFMATTMNSGMGAFLDYQYYLDEQISYTIKPGLTGIVQNTDSLNAFVFVGINYRLNTLRNPLRDRFLNTQPYGGFYPASIEYLMIDTGDPENPGNRLGWSPMGVLGYTVIFANLISLDLHAGFGMSFRLGGDAGGGLTPVAAAGIALGIRL